MQFDDLSLPYGTALQIQSTNSAGQPERSSCRFIGALPGRSLIFSVPRAGGKLGRFRAGQKIAVRLMMANGIGLFASVVQAQTTEPQPLLHVSYPDTIKFKGIRNATRVAVNLPITAINTNAINEVQCTGVCADISISGARIELREAIANIGDTLSLNASMTVAGLDYQASIAAVVRSRIERRTDESAQELPAVYGIEFTEREPQALLILHAYVFAKIIQEQTPRDTD